MKQLILIRQACVKTARVKKALTFILAACFSTNTFASAPAPTAALSIGAASSPLIGNQACFGVDFSNGGSNTGFGPYYRLILPPDLTLASATFLGEALTTDNLGVFPAAPGNQIADSRANNTNVTGTAGFSLTNLVLPLGSVTQNGPTLTTQICVDVSTSAAYNTPLDVSLQPVLEYGDTATGDNGAIAGTAQTGQITPTLMTFSTSNNAPAGKQVPGTTFGLSYTQVVDIANTKVIDSLAIDEQFSSNLTFNQFNPATPTAANGTACAYGANPGSNMTMNCTAVTGAATSSDVTTGFDAYINDILDESTCANQSINHNATLDGSFSSSALPQDTGSNSVSARHVTLIKSLNGSSFNPGATVTVSGTVRVSDYATVSSLSIVDSIPDGLTFAAHSDFTINGGGSVAIVPASVANGDGSGTVTYDVTAVSGNIAGGSLISYSYTATVDTSYNDASPVLASDSFTINSTATYDLTAGASSCTDDHSASLTINPVAFAIEIINPQAEYFPTDVVTYRLTMTVPSGDTKAIEYKTYFPLPVFNVSAVNLTYGNDITRAATDTINSTPSNISIDAANNAITIAWPDITTASTQTLAVDIAITVTDDPFADNLFLTSLFAGQASNTPAAVSASLKPVQIKVRSAKLAIVSGISAISHDGSLSDAASNPPSSNASGVDAGDTMTQTITITNNGGSSAYKINVSQPDLANLTNYNLTSVLLDGVDVSGNTTGSLSTALVFDNSVVIPKEKSLVLTYTYDIAQTANIIEVLQPQTSVTWSASTASATPFTAQQATFDITMADMSIATSVASVTPGGNAGKFVVGDTVTYQANVTLPEGTTTDLVVNFALPAGLQYVNASSNISTAGFTGSLVAAAESTTGVVGTGQTHTFTFTGGSTATNNNNNSDNTFTITLDALVLDDAANAATSSEQSKTLNVTASYQNATGTPSDNVAQNFTEHNLAVTTTVSPDANLQAGDTATVTFVVTNNGTAPAYDVALSNAVDSNLFDLTSVATSSGGCGYANPNFTCSFASIAVGASETVSYTANVQANAVSGSSYTITGSVSGDSQSGSVAGERDQNTNGNDTAATQAISVNSLMVAATSETFTTTAANEPLAIGETITYQLTVDVPEGVSQQTANNDFISFTLPAGLRYVANSGLIRSVIDSSLTSVTLGGSIPTTDSALEPTVDNAASISGQSLTFNLGNIDNNDDDANTEQLIITITALVLNTDTNISAHTLTTTGAVNYLNRASTNQSDSANHSSTVMIPAIALTHSASPTTVGGNDAVTYTLTATNTAGASATNGYDWAITGTLPATLNSPSVTSAVLSRGSFDMSGCASFTGNALSVDGSCLTGGQNGAQHYLAPSETITVVYQAIVDASVGFEQTIDNTMAVSITSLPGSNGAAAPGTAGSDTGERIGDNSNNDSAQAVNDLVASNNASITSGAPTLSLVASTSQAQVLDTTTLTATFGVPVGTNNNLVYTLDLPTGLSYQNAPIVISLPGSNFSTTLSPSTTPGAGTDPIVLDFGTITNSGASAQNVSIAVDVAVANILANQNTSVLTATGSLSYTGVVSAPSDTAAVTVIEPNLTITQTITAGNVGSDAGDTISYQVTVANTNANATAYQVNLADVLPAELLGAPDGNGAGPIFTNIAVTNPGNAIVLNNTATPLSNAHASISTTTNTNDTLGFSAFDLPPSTTLTYSYDVVVANSALVGASVTNTSAASYNSLVGGGGRSGSSANDDDNDAALDNYFESDTSNFTLASAIAIQHSLTTGQADSNFSIGETVSIDVRVDLTEGTTNTVQLQQVLDSGLTFVSASVVAAGNISYDGAGTASESPTGIIAVNLGNVSNSADADNTNDFLIWRVIARVNDNAGNVAAATLNAVATGTSAIGNAGPQTATITVVEPNLVATITPSSATTSLGDEVTFTVLVSHNSSGADAFDTNLDIVIPSGLSYVASSFSGQGNITDTNTSLLNVDLSSIALADTSKSFNFKAKVDNNATTGSALTVSLANTSIYSATSGTTTDDRNYTLSASGATTVNSNNFIDAVHSVAIIGDNGNGVADIGETLEYTITITNNGGASATNVVYNETIPAHTTFTTSSLTTNAGAVDENNNSDLIVNVGTMNSSAVVTITYRVTINAGTPTGTDIIAQGSVDSDQTISELSDSDGQEANGDQSTVTAVGGQPSVLDALYVQQVADWSIDADSNSNVSPGDTVVIGYYIENRGNSQLTGVTVTDTIATGLTYVAASAATGSGTIDVTGSNISIAINSLNAGEQVYASLSVTIDNPLHNSDGDANNETFTMQAAINSNETTATQADQNGIIDDGNQATTISAVTGGGGSANPQVMQTWSLSGDVDSDGLVDSGDEVTYWLTIVNQGSATATNVNLAEVIPTNTTLVAGSLVSSQGVVVTENPVSVNLLNIAPAQIVTLSYKATVNGATSDGTVISAQADVTGGNFAAVKSDDNGNSADGINPTLFTVNNGAASSLGVALQLSATSDNGTTGSNYIQGETLTIQATYTIPAGTTDDLVLDINIPNGLSYQAGSAILTRNFDTGLSASKNPASINNTASGTGVNVDSLISSTSNKVKLALGTVINSDNDSGSETYQLTITLTSAASVATAASNTLTATAEANYLDNLNQSQNPQSTNLTLTLLNRVPIAVNDSDTTLEDTAINLTLMANDSDSDNGQTLTISNTTTPANGGVVVIANDSNSVTYTPAANYVGSDSFDYTLLDSAGGTNTATVTITVTAVQDAPVAANDATTVLEDSTNNTVTVLTNDSDVDGDALTVTSANANNGVVTINGNGTLNYTPTGNFNGSDTISYTISDGNGGTDTATVTVTITPQNDAPVAVADTATVTEDSSNNTITVLDDDTDIDGDTLTATSASALNGTVTINSNGTLNYSPSSNFNGTDTITYAISDGNGGTDTTTVTVTVNPQNDAPVAVNDTVTVNEDSSNNTITVLDDDTDIDGDTITATSANANNGVVTINANGTLNYTPNANFTGTDTISYTISDGNGGTDSATVTVTVNNLNDAPVAVNDTATVDEDSSNNVIIVLDDDTDIDGDTLTVTGVNVDFGAAGINGNGTLNYTPNANFNGTATITYTVSDGNGGTDTATVTVTVTPQNDAPVAVNDTATVDEDSSNNAITVLDDDSDVDGDTLSVTTANANNGSVTVNANGTLNYTPNTNFTGTDTITYTISDGNGGTDTATVTVTVNNLNDAPVAVNDTATVGEDSSNNTIVVLDDDTDIDGDTLTVTNASVDNGTVTINSNGTLNYTPDANFNGTATVTYTVSDGNSGTDTATVTVTVNSVNDAPVAVNDSATVIEDSTTNTIVVLDDDTDIDGDTLTVTNASVDNGTVTVNANGTLNYVPDANFNGTATITYTISDGNGGTDTATVTVTVNSVNDVPVAVNDTATVAEDSTSNTITVLDDDTDVDGDTLTVTNASVDNGTVTVNADGTLNYVPDANFNGTATITYTISDGNGGTATATVTVTVSAVNDLPVAVNDSATVNEDSTTNTIVVLDDDTDIDGDTLTVSNASVDNGTVTVNANGTLNYVPDANFNGTATITYAVSDGNGGTATATVTVTVNSVNDVPVAVDDTATVEEDSTSNPITVLDDDTDVDGDTLTVTNASVDNGTVTVNANGTLNYVPDANFNGTAIISYTISDGNGGTATATVTVTVSAVNDVPVAVNDSATVNEDSTTNTIVVLDDDTDIDGDILTVTNASVDNGTVTVNANGTLNYVPDANFNGTATISYTISDGNGGTATATVTVTVSAVNDLPVAVNDSATVNEDSTTNTIVVLDDDTDIDGDTLTVTNASVDNGTVTVNANGTLNYVPDANFNGTATITYTVSDGNGGTATATVTVTVNSVNDEPVAVDDTATVEEDSTANTIIVLDDDTDIDGDTLTVTNASVDNGTVTVNANGTLNYVPAANFNGTATITYTISDGNGGTATATVTVTVNSVNDAPVAVDDTATVAEDSTANTIIVLDDDTDVDGDTLTVINASVDNGTVSVNANGTLNYVPDANFNGTATITYTISDGNGGTDTASVTVVVTAQNDGPQAQNDVVSVAEDSSATAIDVLQNDSDPDGDNLTVTTANADNGTVTINSDGTISYTPNENFNGTDTITYTVNDGNGATATASVIVTVTSVNDSPVANDDSAVVEEDSSDNSINVLENDTDLDGDALTVSEATATNGTVTINDDGTISYTPNANFSGFDTITYTIADGNGGTATATVNVNVGGTNDLPVAENDTAIVEEDSSATNINVLANDSDADGDALTVSSANANNGTVIINDDGTISYTPNQNFNGTDTITYTIDDGNGGTATATVTVTVTAVNDAPVANDDVANVDEGSTNNVINVLANDTDVDGDNLSVTSATATSGVVTINDDGTISYTPNANFSSTDTITYTVSDGNGGIVTAIVTVTVSNVNAEPIAVNDTASVSQNSSNNIINVLANDSDPDGDSLSVTTAFADNGTVIVNADGSLSYTPNTDFVGTDTISYSIDDGNGGMATATVTVTVTSSNTAPIAVNDTISVTENSNSNIINVLANDSDPDGDSLTVTGATASNGTVTINVDGTISYTPNADFTGTDTITYTISDGKGGTATATVTVTVQAANQAPVAVNDSATVNENSSGNTIDLLANDSDPDGDSLTVTTATASSGSVTVNADGTLSYTPTPDFVGTATITYTISDGNGGTATATVTVTVQAVNQAPVAVNDSVMVNENSSNNAINVLANDSDPDGDSLTVTTVTASNGTVTVNADGTLNYTPAPDFVGTAIITYTISDGNGGTATATVTVTVQAVNQAPVAVNDSATVNENSSGNTVNVLANDSDPDGDNLTVVSANVDNGTVTVNADGTLSYTPAPDFVGTATITYTISDGNGGIATATVTVTVQAVNQAPVAVNDSATVDENSNNNVINVLANDSDPDGDSLTVTSASVDSGTVTVNADGTLSYTPAPDFVGTATITYTISDGNGGTATATVTVTVQAVNQAPVAVNDSATVNENSSGSTINVLANDSDPDGDNLTVVSANVDNGTVSVNADGTLSYTPAPDFVGTAIITYTISDGNGGIATATVTVTVQAVNQAPVAVDDSVTVDENSSNNVINVLTNDSDPDGDNLTVTSASVDSGTVTVNADGTLSYTPAADFVGTATITYTISDGNGGTATATVTVTVQAVNQPPIAVDDSVTVDENSSNNVINVLTNDSDPDGDNLTVVSASVDNGTVTVNADGTLSYTPAPDFVGTVTITYTISDGNGGTATATVTVVVQAVNQPPVAVDDSVTVAEDSENNVINILVNDSDPDGDSLTVIQATSENGTVTINADGTISYTPNANFNGIDIITYTISDGNGGTDTATVTVTITSAQDGPIAVDDFAITEQDTPVVISILDNDSDPDGDQLIVIQATSAFGTVVINEDGTITFTPQNGFTGEAVINYTISDGNGGTASAEVRVVINTAPVVENNPPVAVDDELTVTNTNPVTIAVLGNDFDPDGHSISVQLATTEFGTVEIVDGTLVFTPNEGLTGVVVIYYSIIDELGATATAIVTITIDIEGPTIFVPADLCGEFTVDANALYTRVSLGEASAVDRFGNPLPVSLSGDPLYPPGLNEAYWQATDSEGNTTVSVQKVCVNPLISLEKDQTVPEGEQVRVGVFLNGEAPVYPLTVQYSISGSADGNDHDLVNGEITFEQGSEVYINFNTLLDSLIETNEDIIIDLIGEINMGNKHQHITTINEGNIAPEVSLKVEQAQQERLVVSQLEGLVTVTAAINDPNIGDTFAITWTNPDGMLDNISEQFDRFVFDPANLAIGLYQVEIRVVDSGEPQQQDITSVYIEVVAQLNQLSSELDSDGDLIPDSVEGYIDSDGDGVADYLDRIDECNVLSEKVDVQDGYLIEGEPGVCLRRGFYTVGGETGGAEITQGDIEGDETDALIVDDQAINVGGIFDYIAYGMPEEGTEYAIVMPQLKPIPENAVYRKFIPETGQWDTFVENETNTLWSTAGEPGYCPPPNGDKNDPNNVWLPGLNIDHWCVQMIIEDGGVNDDDGEVNGNIVDPGGVGVLVDNNSLPVAVDDYRTMALNDSITVDALENDSDPDGDALSITSAHVNYGTVEIINNQLFYTSLASFGGLVTINYGISDNNGGSDVAIVYIDFIANSAPVAVDDFSQIDQGQSAQLNLLNNDSDADGDVIRLDLVGDGANNGQVSFDVLGQATFTPNPDFYGEVVINYTISDSVGNIASAQWHIVVKQAVFPLDGVTKGGGGSLSYGLLLLILGIRVTIRRRRSHLNVNSK